jgi:hypothetical protein
MAEYKQRAEECRRLARLMAGSDQAIDISMGFTDAKTPEVAAA